MDKGSLNRHSLKSLISFLRFFSNTEIMDLKFLIFVCVDVIYKNVKTKLRIKNVKKIDKAVLLLKSPITSSILVLHANINKVRILVIKAKVFAVLDIAFSFRRFMAIKFYAIGESMSSIFFRGCG